LLYKTSRAVNGVWWGEAEESAGIPQIVVSVYSKCGLRHIMTTGE